MGAARHSARVDCPQPSKRNLRYATRTCLGVASKHRRGGTEPCSQAGTPSMHLANRPVSFGRRGAAIAHTDVPHSVLQFASTMVDRLLARVLPRRPATTSAAATSDTDDVFEPAASAAVTRRHCDALAHAVFAVADRPPPLPLTLGSSLWRSICTDVYAVLNQVRSLRRRC